jgi:hypothetical protein
LPSLFHPPVFRSKLSSTKSNAGDRALHTPRPHGREWAEDDPEHATDERTGTAILVATAKWSIWWRSRPAATEPEPGLASSPTDEEHTSSCALCLCLILFEFTVPGERFDSTEYYQFNLGWSWAAGVFIGHWSTHSRKEYTL